MSGQLRVDPESVAAAGRDLAGIAQRMADDVATLEAAVGAASDPWGADETGSMFALAYRAVRDVALDAMGSYTEQVGFAAATLMMQARSVAAADAANASSLYGVTGFPGGAAPGPAGDAARGGPAAGPAAGGGPAPGPAVGGVPTAGPAFGGGSAARPAVDGGPAAGPAAGPAVSGGG
ncbi:hypothetical protein [Actinoplanes cyaneus]|uniref:hypothetical protein n=1 Tax=Actinoplanes cyaneus TaxID=52696 RepID=UPI0019450C7E|nr:hypothetical protein [Actinoplanes cyaneus]